MIRTNDILTETTSTTPVWTISNPTRNFRMPEEFWDRFVEERWTAGPLLIRSPFAQPLVTQQEIFRALQAAGEQHRVKGVSELIVFIDGGSRSCDVKEFLPGQEDLSLSSYRQRVESVLSGRQFTLLLPNVQAYNSELWIRTRSFLTGLYDRVGLPGSMADLDVFYGRYDRTPHGIHRDEASNFTYVVSGTKRMFFWPEGTFPGRTGKGRRLLGTMRYEDHLDTASEIVAHEGDLLFWPASYWHIAVSDDEWPLTLNMNSYLGSPALRLLAQSVMMPELEQLLNPLRQSMLPVKAGDCQGTHELSATDEIQAFGRAIRDFGNHQSLQQVLEELWFKKVSATGFDVIPQPATIAQLLPDTILESTSSFPLLLVPRKDGSVRIFANGNALSVQAQPSIRRMVDRINAGCKTTVDSLLTECLGTDTGDTHQADQLRDVLVSLCRFRALTTISMS